MTTPARTKRQREHQKPNGDISLGVLTDIQREVLRRFALSESVREIADHFNRGTGVIYWHLKEAYRKLKLQGPADLTRYAVRNKIITLSLTLVLMIGCAIPQKLPATVTTPLPPSRASLVPAPRTPIARALIVPAPILVKATVSWDPVPDVAAYKIWWGESTNNFTNNVFTSETSVTITNLVVGTTYRFAGTSVTANGFESPEFGSPTFWVANPVQNALVVTIQTSPVLPATNWVDLASFTNVIADGLFYRAKISKP